MQEAVIDGTIDVVCSDHQPEDTESKALEFDYARFGMLGMETFYSLWREAFADRINHQRMYEVLVKNPRSILGLPVPFLKEGVTADFTLYDPACVCTLLAEGIHSTAKNTPFLNRQLTGKVIRSGRG
jgi:dihydroorotase